MKTSAIFLVAILAASRTVCAGSDTNQIIGLLGYSVGTPLLIEGTRVENYKGYGLDVVKVNGQELAKPTRIGLANIAHPYNVSTNVACQFRGTEITFVIKPAIDPKTGAELQQAASGRHFEFKITEVVAPDTVRIREEKSPNHGAGPIR